MQPLVVFFARYLRSQSLSWCLLGCRRQGKTSLHFVDPGTKINGKYYRDVLLMRGLLPDIRSYSEYFTFQQDGAPAHRARETVDLLKQETPDCRGRLATRGFAPRKFPQQQLHMCVGRASRLTSARLCLAGLSRRRESSARDNSENTCILARAVKKTQFL